MYSMKSSQSRSVIISGRTTAEMKAQIEGEAPLRGHTLSQAVGEILKLGAPLYFKRFRKTYERVKKA